MLGASVLELAGDVLLLAALARLHLVELNREHALEQVWARTREADPGDEYGRLDLEKERRRVRVELSPAFSLARDDRAEPVRQPRLQMCQVVDAVHAAAEGGVLQSLFVAWWSTERRAGVDKRDERLGENRLARALLAEQVQRGARRFGAQRGDHPSDNQPPLDRTTPEQESQVLEPAPTHRLWHGGRSVRRDGT